MIRIRQGYPAVILAMVLVGSTVVAGKLVSASFPVFLAGGIRYGLAGLVLLPLLKRRSGSIHQLKISRRAGPVLVAQVFFGQFLFTILLLNGLHFTGGTEAGIISGTTPALIGLLSFFILGEKLTRRSSGGIATTLVGLLVLNLGGANSGQPGEQPLLGNFLVFGAVTGEALFVVLGKLAVTRLDGLTTAALNCLLGFGFFAPFGLYEAFNFDFSQVALGGWLYLVYYALAGTALAYYLWFSGSVHLPVRVLAGVSGVFPASAVVLSLIVLGEKPGLLHLIGIGGVIGGILLLSRQEGQNLSPAGAEASSLKPNA